MDAASLAQTHLQSTYTDISALSGAIPKDKEGLQAAATQFESVFLDMWLQSMRAAGEVFGEGSYLSSDATNTHQEMLDHQLAVHLSESGGIGLRDVIIAQLSPPSAKLDGSAKPADGSPVVAQVPQRTLFPDSTESSDGLVSNGFKAAGFESLDDFLDTVLPAVKQAVSALAFNPIGVVAQAALETGWGSRMIHGADGEPSRNLFGVKSHDWDGDSVRVATLEHEFGEFVERSEQFRAYPSWQDAVADYVKFLQDNPRYQTALANAEDPHTFADELQQAGYATDPSYAEKMKQIIDQLQGMLAN